MEVHIPSSSQSLPTFFFMFLSLYLFGYLLVFRSWGPKHRSEASSCFISLAHGTPAVIMAILAIIRSQNPTDFAAPNTNFQNAVLEYSIAYFSLDLLHYILFHPRDFVFICHHLATLYVFVTCRYLIRHGSLAILVLLVLAELTSGCQNVWSLAGFRRADVPAAAKLQDSLSPYFYTWYSLLRGGVAPIFVHQMGRFYASIEADNVIPKWAWVSWMIVIATAILVSILWVGNHWVAWYRKLGHRQHEKSS